jgi:hypothetical protein
MGIIISYNELAELNNHLEGSGFAYKVHMHDLCGSQSFSVKSLDGSETGESELIKECIRDYFMKKSITAKFSENGTEFVLS